MEHQPVLLNEVILGLAISSKGTYVDCTLGRGGHSEAILKRATEGHLIAFDQDEEAIIESKKRLKPYEKQITYIHANFVRLKEELLALGIKEVDGVLMDLGVSSPQFDDGKRGFSYRYDARLDMRMNQDQDLTAYDVINTYDVRNLTRIFRDYGEEPFAYEIAKRIIKEREKGPITTTFDLVNIIKKALPPRALSKKGHPAKQVFQAIRIEVNDELNILRLALNAALSVLKVKGRLAIITFHSLEDRIVKRAFKEATSISSYTRGMPIILEQEEPDFVLVNKHATIASDDELAHNPRSKSAKLRIIERRK